MNTGEFLKQKMGNMADWLGEEIKLSPLEATLVCQELYDRKREAIEARDWEELQKGVPSALRKVVERVHTEPEKHDKFWRYLSLFVATISSVGG
jgi:hypothetical protein